jgi:hypothetical protein
MKDQIRLLKRVGDCLAISQVSAMADDSLCFEFRIFVPRKASDGIALREQHRDNLRPEETASSGNHGSKCVTHAQPLLSCDELKFAWNVRSL